jgi:hypothetical protein
MNPRNKKTNQETFNSRVSLLFLNGIKGYLIPFSVASARAWIQFPKTSKD